MESSESIITGVAVLTCLLITGYILGYIVIKEMLS